MSHGASTSSRSPNLRTSESDWLDRHRTIGARHSDVNQSPTEGEALRHRVERTSGHDLEYGRSPSAGGAAPITDLRVGPSVICQFRRIYPVRGATSCDAMNSSAEEKGGSVTLTQSGPVDELAK